MILGFFFFFGFLAQERSWNLDHGALSSRESYSDSEPYHGKLVAARGTAKENHVAFFPSLGFCGRRRLAAPPADFLMLPPRPEKSLVLPSSIALQTFGAWPCGEGVIPSFLVTGKLMPVALGGPQQRDIAVYILALSQSEAVLLFAIPWL